MTNAHFNKAGNILFEVFQIVQIRIMAGITRFGRSAAIAWDRAPRVQRESIHAFGRRRASGSWA
jgi:hypothetical protein